MVIKGVCISVDFSKKMQHEFLNKIHDCKVPSTSQAINFLGRYRERLFRRLLASHYCLIFSELCVLCLKRQFSVQCNI